MDARKGYQARRYSQKNKAAKIARIELIKTGQLPQIQKMSGQIQDPFNEKMEGFGGIIRPPYRLETLLDFYEDNTWNNVCCNLKSNLVCGLYDLRPVKEGQKEDAEYEKLNSFLQKPNESGEDSLDLFNKFWVDAEATGNAYFEIVRNGLGQMSEIYQMPAQTVRASKVKDIYLHMRRGFAQKMIPFKRWGSGAPGAMNEVVHYKNYFPASKFYGLPDFLPALGAMALDRNAVLFNNGFFINGGMLGSILFVNGAELSPDARRELKNMIQGNFTGMENAQRMAIVDGLGDGVEFKIEKVMESMRDMSFERMRKFDRDEILAAHHVPPKMVHVAEPGRLGESKDGYNQMKFFKLFEIDPSQRRMENILNNLFEHEMGIKNWKIKFTPLDIRDPGQVSEELWGDLDHAIITIPEARLKRGLNIPEEQALIDDKDKVSLTGIQIENATAIIQAVNNEEMTPESGINQLMIFFNLTQQQAENLIGVKKNKMDELIKRLERNIKIIEKEILYEGDDNV